MPIKRSRYGTRRAYSKKKSYPRRGNYRRYNPNVNWQTRSIQSNNIMTVPGGYPFPERLKTQLVYQSVVNATFAAGAAVTSVFRGNSLFDPDTSALVGVKANAIDILSSIYNVYGVIGSKIEVDFVNAEAVPIRVFIIPYQSTSLTDMNFATVSALPNNVTAIVPVSTGGGIRKLTKYMSTKKMLNLDPATDDSVQALTTANPINQWYWQVYARPVDSLTASVANYVVKITYYSLFSSRKVTAYV